MDVHGVEVQGRKENVLVGVAGTAARVEPQAVAAAVGVAGGIIDRRVVAGGSARVQIIPAVRQHVVVVARVRKPVEVLRDRQYGCCAAGCGEGLALEDAGVSGIAQTGHTHIVGGRRIQGAGEVVGGVVGVVGYHTAAVPALNGGRLVLHEVGVHPRGGRPGEGGIVGPDVRDAHVAGERTAEGAGGVGEGGLGDEVPGIGGGDAAQTAAVVARDTGADGVNPVEIAAGVAAW